MIKRQRIKNNTNKIPITYLFMVMCVIYIFISEMLFYYKMENSIFLYTKTYIARYIICFFSLGILTSTKWKLVFNNKIFKVILLLNLITIITTLFNYNYSFYGTISTLLIVLFTWCATFVIAFVSVFNNNCFDKAVKFVMLFFPICVMLFLVHTFSYQYTDLRSPNTVYYILLFTPYILTLKKNYLKLICIVTVFICVVISMKRTALIGLVIAIFLYYLNELFTNNKVNKKNIMTLGTLLLVIIICIFSYNYAANYYNIDFVSRLAAASTDGGSGRIDIWKEVWRQQKDLDFLYWITGKGWNGVVFNANIVLYGESVSAHTDFLEVLYDYGIFGMMLYLIFICKLIIYAIKMIIKKIEFAAAFSASIVIFIAMSIFSHLIIYPDYFYLLMIYWGMCIAKYELIDSSKVGI